MKQEMEGKRGLGQWIEGRSNEQVTMLMCFLLLLLGSIGLTVLINSPA